MKAKWIMRIFLAAVVGTGMILHPQTASELLQKGIYMQETVGDLDGAIKLYRQVVQMGKDSRANAAQAQYRLGICLLKKGQPAEAAKTFQEVIEHYPDQAEVTAKARALLAGNTAVKLLPAPWVDGEILELKMKMGNGTAAGSIRYSVQTSRTNRDYWLFEARTANPGMLYRTRVEADKETMKPIASAWANMPVLGGDIQINYQDGEARVEKKGKEAKTLALDGAVWDNEECWALMRRLPLAPGYKTSLAIVSPAGILVKIGLSVTGVEDVQTPAGNFHCYRVELDTINQTFYYSTDASRYLVKFEASGMITALLQTIGRIGSPTAGTYRNEKLGFSIATPAGWSVDGSDSLTAKTKSLVQLVDPDSFAIVTLAAEPVKPEEAATAASMRAEAEKSLGEKDDQKVRPDSWQVRQVGGRPAISWLADFTDPFSRKLVVYTVRVRGESTRADFKVMAAANEFDAVRARVDPMIETLTVK